jgi:hypothetical protein
MLWNFFRMKISLKVSKMSLKNIFYKFFCRSDYIFIKKMLLMFNFKSRWRIHCQIFWTWVWFPCWYFFFLNFLLYSFLMFLFSFLFLNYAKKKIHSMKRAKWIQCIEKVKKFFESFSNYLKVFALCLKQIPFFIWGPPLYNHSSKEAASQIG